MDNQINSLLTGNYPSSSTSPEFMQSPSLSSGQASRSARCPLRTSSQLSQSPSTTLRVNAVEEEPFDFTQGKLSLQRALSALACSSLCSECFAIPGPPSGAFVLKSDNPSREGSLFLYYQLFQSSIFNLIFSIYFPRPEPFDNTQNICNKPDPRLLQRPNKIVRSDLSNWI